MEHASMRRWFAVLTLQDATNTVSNVVLPGLAVYGPLKLADGGMWAAPSFRSASERDY